VLALQRSAGNAAVAKLMRNGGGGSTQERPRAVTVFLNSYTPLMRGLLAKLDAGERLDRVDLDTLRQLGAEARALALHNLVADCQEAIARATERGIVPAPEEAAPEELTASGPEPAEAEGRAERHPPVVPPSAVAGLVAALGAAMDAAIKDQVRESGHLDNLRGGRHHGRVGGVDYTLYDLDDILLTTEDANAIEAALRRVEQQRGGLMDTGNLWRTVVALCRDGVPPADILAMLELYDEPPSLSEWFAHWWRQAASAAAKHEQATFADEDVVPSPLEPQVPVAEAALTSRRGPTGLPVRTLLQQHAHATGEPSGRLLALLDRLKRERAKLVKIRNDYNTLPGASAASEQFDNFDLQLVILASLRNHLNRLFKKRDWAALLAFDQNRIDEAIAGAHRAAARVRAVANEAAGWSSEAENATRYVKSADGSPTPTRAVRKGGSDGVWDAGFASGELAKWLEASTKRPMNSKSVNDCASYIQVHKTTGGSGGTSTHFRGAMVYHISHGKQDSTDGCTVFFTHAPDGTITIVGVGSHSAIASVAYKLDWKHPEWTEGHWKGNILIIKK
jgi:hypothetical protein